MDNIFDEVRLNKLGLKLRVERRDEEVIARGAEPFYATIETEKRMGYVVTYWVYLENKGNYTVSNPNYSPPAREETDGLCPACLSESVGYDVVSYLSGVSAPDGGAETLTEEQLVCYDCGERAALATRGGVQYTPETLMEALKHLRRA